MFGPIEHLQFEHIHSYLVPSLPSLFNVDVLELASIYCTYQNVSYRTCCFSLQTKEQNMGREGIEKGSRELVAVA